MRGPWHGAPVYATVYTRRGMPHHELFLMAYLEHGQYVHLSGEPYRILDVVYIPLAEAWRWSVCRVDVCGVA